MEKAWISGSAGVNLKFKHETLLNYAMNRRGLNKSYRGGSTSELIRAWAPATHAEWEHYYFTQARRNKKD